MFGRTGRLLGRVSTVLSAVHQLIIATAISHVRNSAVFSQNLTTTNFSKKFFLQFST